VQIERLERMDTGAGGCTLYDTGFYNIGVRPTADDLGVAGTDPWGNSLSESKMVLQGKLPNVAAAITPALGSVPNCDGSANVDGSFKAPGLRNVELTGPYFHNGGKATLRQVVDFYSRGGDFAAQNAVNLDGEIKPLGLSDGEKSDLVAFLVSLTDERVRWQRAPFDHPSLCVANGALGDGSVVQATPDGVGADAMICIPQTGVGGATVPFQPFLGLDPFQATGVAPTPTATPLPPTPTPTATVPPTLGGTTSGGTTSGGTASGGTTSGGTVMGLPAGALLQSWPTSVPTATPTPAPSTSTSSSSPFASAPRPAPTATTPPSVESSLQQQLSAPVPVPPAPAPPADASPAGQPSGPLAAVSSPAPATQLSGSSGLPSSAIFTPASSATAPAASAPALATPVFVVVDPAAGGVLVLDDQSLRLVIPAGVAETDVLTVSLTEVDPTTTPANLQVGDRAFILTVVDGGGATLNSFAAPISVLARPANADPATAAISISALDPDSNALVPADAAVQPDLQTAVALERIGTPPSVAASEPSLGIASVSAPSAASSQPSKASPPPGDPQAIARSEGLIP
jgi:hypothetical protein